MNNIDTIIRIVAEVLEVDKNMVTEHSKFTELSPDVDTGTIARIISQVNRELHIALSCTNPVTVYDLVTEVKSIKSNL